jgi:hypothetical protein
MYIATFSNVAAWKHAYYTETLQNFTSRAGHAKERNENRCVAYLPPKNQDYLKMLPYPFHIKMNITPGVPKIIRK